jgi:hypothetical protein
MAVGGTDFKTAGAFVGVAKDTTELAGKAMVWLFTADTNVCSASSNLR